MDFARVLREIIGFLKERHQRFALTGGLALAAYGHGRTTVDLDLVVEAEAQDELIRFMEDRGYETLHRSAGYSNHRHSDARMGRVDFIYVRGETAARLFAASRRFRGPGDLEIPVPKPEHLAAMKVLAMKNDPERTFEEMADVRFLLALPGVDREEIRAQFVRHGLEDRYRELEASL